MTGGPICTECGLENEAGATACRSCGAAMPREAPQEREARKLVTIVFCDLVESTRLGEDLDPESLRGLMSRYFDEMRQVLERHGGAVEKFIGDAVMAVFGVPQVHEDDALRAVRAAVEMREALRRLNEELARSWGVTIEARTGVSTGEVIAGGPGGGRSFVVGDAVNTAARLEQSAGPGEILVGESTYRLVREAVVAEEVASLALKGKPRPVRAVKVVDVIPDAPGWSRRMDSPLVGRQQELSLLRDIFQRTVEGRTSQLVTLMGVAGVGKSRLTEELRTLIRGEAVITGRCLPYGEGITFWPIASVLRDAARISERDGPEEARAKITELIRGESDADLVGERLAPLLGIDPARPAIQETFWGVRKLFEHLAARQPLVVVFDDIHWGEATFLDLLEYLADWITTAPVLFLCLTRPELLETRPWWMTGKPNATVINLRPLTDDEIDGLIGNLAGGAELDRRARARIDEVAEGNPLFVEETLRMLVDEGVLQPLDGKWVVAGDIAGVTIPETIQALLTARLDRLEPEERAVIERASVVGRIFWWGAVSELSPAALRPRVIVHLQSLTRKELIRPDPSEVGHEISFSFAHILVRDAAYQAIPKAERVELHERLADWIEVDARNLAGEYEEILGYHVEQATRLLLELGPPSERTAALGKRAATALAEAGTRAFARGDMPAAANLLSRAASLLPEKRRDRATLLPELAFALFETGDLTRLQEVVSEATEIAEASGDPDLEAHAIIMRLWMEVAWSPRGWAETAEEQATKAITAFEAAGDERGLGKAWSLLALVHLERAHFEAAEEAWLRAADHAHRADDRRDELENLAWAALAVWAGPTHARDGLRRCADLVERARGDKKAMASAIVAQAAFEAESGRFDEARALIRRAKALLQEVALPQWLAGPVAQLAGWVELLAGDPVAAELELRSGYDTLREIGEQSWLSSVAAVLAESVYAQGRLDEAERLTGASVKSAGEEDAYSHALVGSVRAKVLARRGGNESARMAHEAVNLADTTDFLHLCWHARMSLAEVLRLTGQDEAVGPILEQAIGIAERKGNVVGARRARDLLDRTTNRRPAPPERRPTRPAKTSHG